MKRSEKAVEIFNLGFNCAQSVLSAYSEEYGLKKEDALKISCGFGAGMGRMQSICGAVSAAFMIIGLAKGNTKVEDEDKREKTYHLMKVFRKVFEEKHNTILCRELLNCDLNVPEGKKQFKDNELFDKVCIPCVKDAVEILEEILD